MIITCPNCKKKFNIDPTLIPEDGRDLKCGSCNHVWLYKIEDVSSKPLTLNESNYNNEIDYYNVIILQSNRIYEISFEGLEKISREYKR